MDTLPKLSAYIDYSEFLSKNELPGYFDSKTSLYNVNGNLIHNPEGKKGVGVITSWVEPSKFNADAEWVGSGYSIRGLDLLIRNWFANPEIKILVIAGSNIKNEIPSASTLLRQLIVLHKEIKNRGEDSTDLINWIEDNKYNLTKEVKEYLWYFLENVQVIDCYEENGLSSKNLEGHCLKVNSIIQNLKPEEVPDRSPLYLSFSKSEENETWLNDKIPHFIDGRNLSIQEIHKIVIAYIKRFGEKLYRRELGNEGNEDFIIEVRGLQIELDPNMPIADDESTQAYLDMFSSSTESVADYTYGNKVSEQIDTVVEKLKGGSKMESIQLFQQQDIFAKNPSCLIYIEFQLIASELVATVYIRSNDMQDAWPMNATGMVYLAQQVAKKLNVNLARVTTISESAHIRAPAIEDANALELPNDSIFEIEQGERVSVNLKMNSNDRVQFQFGDIEFESAVKLDGIEKVGTVMNEIIYSKYFVASPDSIIRLTVALTELFYNKNSEIDIVINIDSIDPVIDLNISKTTGVDKILHTFANSIRTVTEEGTLYIPDLTVLLSDKNEYIPVKFDIPFLEDLEKIIKDKVHNKAAILKGIEYDTFLEDGTKITLQFPFIQFLIGSKNEVTITGLLASSHISQELMHVENFLRSLQTDLVNRLNNLVGNLSINNSSDFVESKFTTSTAKLLLRLPWVLESEIDLEQYSKSNIPTYVEDVKGWTVLNIANNRMQVTLANKQNSQDIEYDLTELSEERLQNKAYEIATDIVIRRQAFSQPGHVVYIARAIYQKLLSILRSDVENLR